VHASCSSHLRQAKSSSSTTQPTTPPFPHSSISSPSSSDNINALFDCPTPPSPSLSQMADDQHRDSPPHLTSDIPQSSASNPPSAANSPPPVAAPPPPQPPAMDPHLQLAMTTLIEAMTCQFLAQAPLPANPPHRQGADRHLPTITHLEHALRRGIQTHMTVPTSHLPLTVQVGIQGSPR
jgi:hypothetical protein